MCVSIKMNKKEVDHEEKKPYKTDGIYSGIKRTISHVAKAKCQFD